MNKEEEQESLKREIEKEAQKLSKDSIQTSGMLRGRMPSNPQKGVTQEVKGGLRQMTIMPKYGTPSYIYRKKLELPWIVERNPDEKPEDFFKRLAAAHARIREQLIKIIGIKPEKRTGGRKKVYTPDEVCVKTIVWKVEPLLRWILMEEPL